MHYNLYFRGPLSGYILAVFGKFASPKSVIEKKLMELGAAVSQKIDSSVKFCISTESKLKFLLYWAHLVVIKSANYSESFQNSRFTSKILFI